MAKSKKSVYRSRIKPTATPEEAVRGWEKIKQGKYRPSTKNIEVYGNFRHWLGIMIGVARGALSCDRSSRGVHG